MTERNDRLAALRPFAAEAQRLRGWNLAYQPRPLRPPAPWDYEARARELAKDASRLIDLGTGGGEVFERILAGYQGQAWATEGWAPNAPVARRRLRHLGVPVTQNSSLALPFAAGSVDLVLDRHEELSPAEVARVLRPGGRLLTQQVHPDYFCELRAYFPRMTRFERHDETYPRGLAEAGLAVVGMQQHSQQVAYQHLGHLIYFLAAAPWTVPDFDLDDDLEALLAAERGLGGPDGIVLSDPRYLLEAHKAP